MEITPQHYVPLLRWRMGEYQALEKLDDAEKDAIVPLLEVLPPDYDFEQRRPKKDIDEQLKNFGAKLRKKWGARPALLDGLQLTPSTRMADGRHFMTYLFDEARAHGTSLTAVTALDRDGDYQEAVRLIHRSDLRGAALRCTLEEGLDPDFDANVGVRLETLEIEADLLDVILDLKTPMFEPLDGLLATIAATLSGSTIFADARSVTILATSFPEAMTELKLPLQSVPRREWTLYKALLASFKPGRRRPAFGDYGIAAVKFAQGDMRFMRGSPNVRYAINDAWLVAKAKREKGGSNKPYPGLCSSIVQSGHFLGTGFSAGSAYIDGCSAGTQKKGNPTVWKWVATNHHITKVVDDLAMLHGI
jgi:hypothetical protein